MSALDKLEDRIFSGCDLFMADIELRRMLLAKRYRPPIPFISIMNFGLHLQVDQSPFVASPESNPSPGDNLHEPA